MKRENHRKTKIATKKSSEEFQYNDQFVGKKKKGIIWGLEFEGHSQLS